MIYVVAASSGIDPELETGPGMLWVFAIGEVACLFLDMLSGFIAAALAKGSKMLNAIAAGVLITVIFSPFGALEPGCEVIDIASRILMMPAVLLGGYLVTRWSKKSRC